MPTCIYSKKKFETATREHILQNFLGSRWDSPLIVSSEVQAQFARTIDAQLAKSLTQLRTLIGFKSGRGGEAPPIFGTSTVTGKKIKILSGGRSTMAEPEYEISNRRDGSLFVRGKMGHRNQLGWLLHKIQKERPDLKIDEATAAHLLTVNETYFEGAIHHSLGIGGIDYFRGLAKSCFNLLGALEPEIALRPEFDSVRHFVLSGTGKFTDFVRWPHPPPEVEMPTLGDFGHFIGIVSKDTAVDGVVQLFGSLSHPVRLSESYSGPPIKMGYLVDPMREAVPPENRQPVFDSACIPHFEDQAALPTPEVRPTMIKSLSGILERYYARAHPQELLRIFKETLGTLGEGPIPQDKQTKLADALARYLARFMKPPGDG